MKMMLEIRNLTTRFMTHEGVVHAVNGNSFGIEDGEILGIVGESGSGKSVSMLSILGLIPRPPGVIAAGEVWYRGRDLLKLSHEALRQLRGKEIAMIFQDPMTSLNPVLTIGYQLVEGLREHMGMSAGQARRRAADLLGMVGIPRPAERLGDYPHQFSGGMRQRVMIAMAISCMPSLLIADEPTTALDVTIQAQIIDLVHRLQGELDMAVIWITHDLGVIARLARRVLVMYAGYIVEQAPVEHLFHTPRHPYTLGLLGSLPRLDQDERRLQSIAGQPPDLIHLPLGCPFSPRCAYSTDRCRIENPALQLLAPEHWAACWESARLEGALNDATE